MDRKSRFVQDTEVLIYRLNHGNVAEAKQLLDQLTLTTGSLADELDEGRRKEFLEGTSELMAGFRERIGELEEAGNPPEEIAEVVLAEMNEQFDHELTAFTLEPSAASASVDWASTADQLLEQNEWLHEELERSERDYMELYRRAKEDGSEQEAR